MNRISLDKRQAVVASLVEGNSLRSTSRMTGVSLNTVTKLLVDLGTVCSIHQDQAMRNLSCKRLQVDEIWSFVYAKQKNVPRDKKGEAGDVWTWVALDSDTKLVPSYRVGSRDLQEAILFMDDLAGRLANRVQLTTDGHRPYLTAVPRAFGNDVDYAQLVKVYGQTSDSSKPNRRYSPGVCLDAVSLPMIGSPDLAHISTSHVERLNLTTRMSVRRYTRLTNAFSKKLENHTAAVSLHFMHYNYCRKHLTLKTSPAVAAGVTDRVWKIEDIIGLLEAAEATPVKRGSYKPRQSTISK
ncbi:MAG TPA: IS1 family transposase [Gaiellaceae bacterium]|nr:IS1 family transposase [Gaiellaceae bacterium]